MTAMVKRIHHVAYRCKDALACNTALPGMLEAFDKVKWDMLEEWAQTNKAPKHAAWMHDGSYKEMFK